MSDGRAAPPPGLELLLRLVAEELQDSPCPRCGQPLQSPPLALKSAGPERAAIEVTCAACGERHLVGVEPGGEDGVPALL